MIVARSDQDEHSVALTPPPERDLVHLNRRTPLHKFSGISEPGFPAIDTVSACHKSS